MIACVIDKNKNPLMPMHNPKKLRRLLKEKRAVIYQHDPFTIMLTYDIANAGTQPVELTEDTGYQYIGLSVKSEKHEYISREYKLLPDEKKHHQAQKRIRNARRNRLRYRKPMTKRAANSRHTEKGWLAPSLKHKADQHVELVKKYMAVLPITSVTLEMGQFDTQVLTAVQEGKPVPEGLDYQHGPKYGYDTLREAVFARDKYKCKVCKKSAIKDNAVLVIHHIGFRKKDRSNRPSNLMTLCSNCHIPSAHKEGGALWNLKPIVKPLGNAAFMNSVKWYIYGEVKKLCDNTHITYGAVTKRERLNRNIEKSHANDAYCIGNYHPKHRAKTQYFAKRRRNNRCLEKFYDAKIIDIRTGKTVKGAKLSCNRTKRKVPRKNKNNLRCFRGRTVTKGYRSIRGKRHIYQAGDIVWFQGEKHIVKTCRFKTPKKKPPYETVEFTDNPQQVCASLVKPFLRISGWKEVTKDVFVKAKA